MVQQRSEPVSPRVRRSTSRAVFLGGILVAVIGVPLFFGPGLQFAEAGIGLICLGLGVAVGELGRRILVDDVAAARRSKVAAAAMLLTAPHHVAAAVVGLGLVLFGVMVLGIALGLI